MPRRTAGGKGSPQATAKRPGPCDRLTGVASPRGDHASRSTGTRPPTSRNGRILLISEQGRGLGQRPKVFQGRAGPRRSGLRACSALPRPIPSPFSYGKGFR